MPDRSAYVLVETVNVGHISPHSCTITERIRDRRGDTLVYRDAEASKTCAIEIAVAARGATLRESPKDCFELARHHCGAHGFMLGRYDRR